MKILFTICGRAGSKGFKNKNLKKMNGVPLVFYTLASIRAFQQENPGHQITVAVNTDSPELVSCIQSQQVCQDIRFVERKAELAGDTAPKVAVIQDTYLTLAKDQDFDVVIDLDITSPYRRAIDIANVVAEFQKDPAYDLVFSVVLRISSSMMTSWLFRTACPMYRSLAWVVIICPSERTERFKSARYCVILA